MCVWAAEWVSGVFFKTRVYQEKGREAMEAIRKAWYFSCKKKKKRKYKYVQKENILQAIHSNVSSGCFGVWIMNHLFLSSIFLIFVKQT